MTFQRLFEVRVERKMVEVGTLVEERVFRDRGTKPPIVNLWL